MGYAEQCVDMFPVKVKPYLKIMRLHDPTLSLMVFWPAAWNIELSDPSIYLPHTYLLIIFFLESFILNGAGSILDDIFDRSVDNKVERSQNRPLVTGELSLKQAVGFLIITLSIGVALLLQFDWKCMWLLVLCAVFSTVYPITKRFMYLPEIVLGVSCSFSVLVGWVASTGDLEPRVSFLYIAGVLYWTVSDTIYNSQDKHQDIKIGVKSAALNFGKQTKVWLWWTGCTFIMTLAITGYIYQQTWPYYVSVLVTGVLISCKVSCVDLDDPISCYKHYSFSIVGFTIFLGIMMAKLIK